MKCGHVRGCCDRPKLAFLGVECEFDDRCWMRENEQVGIIAEAASEGICCLIVDYYVCLHVMIPVITNNAEPTAINMHCIQYIWFLHNSC